ncbi:dihydroxyacetone kinase subunit DhaK [Moritella sp.]|uniref:dihydroxyacetone kinase subunit DhaK n=1 Tax=Moritella sp. TaxID=78556 RepID=UPI001E160BD2|nr:dihydroxyacetone kinase subunit DhaK [Moritella sp.]MCJ8348704.1 dihydroxyacetone kinase subunit DhaK [Moritella sp.]NQZ38581.1 dihydroxyacetone kinase subunit DhaK [Moritella sp.]
MKKLINKIENVVKEQVEGLNLAHPELKLSLDPRYIWRDDAQGKVALLSGGGNGHEPLHAGFIGKGMLTAACPGEIFSSPTPDQMYECGHKINNDNGILFIIKNYTGDVLNFETAVEMLHADGIKVGSVLIDDDVAVKDSLYTAGRRGVAATVLVEKIVGAAAEEGYSLEQCEKLARRVNNISRSFGVALSACVVPAAGKPSFVLADDEIEFGVGIHGEPGIERRTYKDLDSLVDQMFAELIDCPPYTRELREWNRELGEWQDVEVVTEEFKADSDYIVLVNGLGGTPGSELYGAYRRLHQNCESAGYKIARNLIGNYCTSLNMEGFSITLLKADDEILRLWDAPVNTPALRWGC